MKKGRVQIVLLIKVPYDRQRGGGAVGTRNETKLADSFLWLTRKPGHRIPGVDGNLRFVSYGQLLVAQSSTEMNSHAGACP